MLRKLKIVFIFLGISILTMCRKPENFPDAQYDERLSGGSQSVFDFTSKAFTHELNGLNPFEAMIHEEGDAAFEQTFVTAPAPVNSGLGGAFNNVSCISCHHNDGKGVPTAGFNESSLLMRISFSGRDLHGAPIPVPGYGTQIQDQAIFGKQPEAKVNISYNYQMYSFPDGDSYELRTPTYTLSNLYLPINGTYLLSPRLAPSVFGLGLLEAIPEEEILKNEDQNDLDQDGISGKANFVWDPNKSMALLGRFGLKANTASLLTQVAAAYNNDIGITSYVFPKETNLGQTQNDNYADEPELPDSILNAVTFYIQTLQVPARRNVNDPVIRKGKQIFSEAKCQRCHVETFNTAVNVSFPALSNQRIHPYSDLLLHDMGDGLSDNRSDFAADGNEWRTTPLWGLGLLEKVNFPAYYLHDGRARSILEAIMWHDGEGKISKDYVSQLSKSDRNSLLQFLKSL